MITLDYMEAIAKRAFQGPAACAWSGWKLRLASTDVAGANTTLTLADLSELDDAEGYAPIPLSWAVVTDADGADARAAVANPAWRNTGTADWPECRAIFVTAQVDGVERLMWFLAVAPFTLAPNDTVALQDNLVEMAWRAKVDGQLVL